MPSGLLKVSTWLREIGYDIRLSIASIQMAAVKSSTRSGKVVQVCSTVEWALADYRSMVKERMGQATIELPPHHRYKFEFGLSASRSRGSYSRQRGRASSLDGRPVERQMKCGSRRS